MITKQIREDGVYKVEYDEDENIISEERVDKEYRIVEVERSVGRNGKGERGIAARIDELEDRIDELESDTS